MSRFEGGLILFVVAVSLLAASEARSVRQRNRHARNRQDNIQQYYWMCPDVVCPPVARSCQHVEYFVFEYDYEVTDGRVVKVRCESCEYCLDLPSFLQPSGGASQSALAPEESSTGHRRRRSIYDALGERTARADSAHQQITCPDLPPACADVRMTNVFISDRRYGRCPACYDSTVVKNL